MNKKRTTIWLSQDVMDRLDEMTKTDDSKSRSEFIERAIKFYDGYNRSTLENQYLPVAISSAVQGTVKSSENRISKLLYKNTVELSMVMNVLSAIADVDNDTLKKLRVKCMNEVKATNGKISFEEINKKEVYGIFFTSFEECQEFCSYLNKKEGVTGYDYDREGNLIAESTGEDNE